MPGISHPVMERPVSTFLAGNEDSWATFCRRFMPADALSSEQFGSAAFSRSHGRLGLSERCFEITAYFEDAQR